MKPSIAARRRLNFIPEELRPTLLTPKLFLAVTAVALLGVPAVGAGTLALRWTAERSLASATTRRDDVSTQVALRTKARDASADRLLASAVKKALAEKVYWADAFKELTNLAPKSVWLENFNTDAADTSGKKVVISGFGTSQVDIAEFFARLEKSYFFRFIEIKYTEMSEVNGGLSYRFQFEGRIFDDETGGGHGSN